MTIVRSLIAGAGVGLCLCATARADDYQIKSADRKPAAKASEAKQLDAQDQTNQSEDAGALDRLTVQAQKEEANPAAEPGGIEPR